MIRLSLMCKPLQGARPESGSVDDDAVDADSGDGSQRSGNADRCRRAGR